ncbi:hypothetical protein BKA62DRAFT_833739 [Auriculariales sp. MPI-PUGE-AT-0066]|nr:hypothetical protein BKA62DRAFT_833739 [Auriculariales sp. MPI-PUGE-AT-0066]
MAEKLPIELVDYILRLAAYQFRFHNRSTVVKLALTSSFVYNIVAPILYERLIVESDTEVDSFSEVMDDKAVAASVLKHVRVLCSAYQLHISSSVAAHFVKLEAVYGSINTWSSIAQAQARSGSTIAAEVRFWTVDLPADFPQTYHHTEIQNLTHVHSFMPNFALLHTFLEISRDAAGWTRHILELLPRLTHLGFSHVSPEEPSDEEEAKEKDLGVFELIVKTVAACQKPCVQVLAVRLTGSAVARVEAYIRVAQAANEDWATQRVCIWLDKREVRDWTDEVSLMAEDARRECTIWTESKPLKLHLEAASAA